MGNIIKVLIIVLWSLTSGQVIASPALPGEKCQVTPHSSWSETEKWAWIEICEGRIADLVNRIPLAPDLVISREKEDPVESSQDSNTPESVVPNDTESLEDWDDWESRDDWDDWDGNPEIRKLSQNFIEMVLLHNPWRNAIPRQGLRIIGAHFSDSINLSNSKLDHQIWLQDSTFLQKLDLHGSSIGGYFNLSGSTFEGQVNMDRLRVGSSLFMNNRTVFKGELTMDGAIVDGILNMESSRFDKNIDFSSLEVKGSWFMRYGATLKRDLILRGVKVGGSLEFDRSTFEGKVHIDTSEVASNFFLRDKTTFKKNLILRGVKIGGAVSMKTSSFEDDVSIENTRIIGPLFMQDGAIFKSDLTLIDVNVGSNFEMDGSTFEGEVDLSDVDVNGNMFMGEGASFKKVVNFRGVKLHSNLEMDDSTFEGKLKFRNLEVANNVSMDKKAMFKEEVVMKGVKVGGELRMENATYENLIDMDNLVVAGKFSMRSTDFSEAVKLNYSSLESELNLSNSLFSELNLSGTRIRGELRLGSDESSLTRWRNGGVLVLHNTHAATIQDQVSETHDAWPHEIHFDGFTYERLGGFLEGESGKNMLGRDTKWYIDWLERGPSYSPQPYEQLASVFRSAGNPKKANDILFASRERERSDATGITWFGLSLLKWTIGYGLGRGYFRALWWVFGLVALGMIVLRISGEGKRNKMPYGLSFSFDHLLPVVHLRKYHFDIRLNGWARYYFYIHKLMGYVLASFLIAGMAGLTQ